MRALLLLLIAPVGTGVAREQPPDMVTDRPDQTESAAVVPRGLLQVETGYLFARDGDVDGHAVPGTLFRLGLGGRLELRIGHVGIVGGAGLSSLTARAAPPGMEESSRSMVRARPAPPS